MGKKGKNINEESGSNVGSIMGVSLFLIILTFFILLNSIAVIDDRRVHMAIGSLLGAFGSFNSGLSPLKTGKSVMPPTAPLTKERYDVEKLLSTEDKKTLSLIKFESFKDREVISINKEVLFDKNKLELKPSSYSLLNKLCDFIEMGSYSVDIVGHTDNTLTEAKGYKSNWELSTLMAIRILRYFLENGKISPGRLAAQGFAGYNPIVPNDTKELRALNRRVDVILNFKAPAYIKRIYRKKPAGVFTYKKFDFRVFE